MLLGRGLGAVPPALWSPPQHLAARRSGPGRPARLGGTALVYRYSSNVAAICFLRHDLSNTAVADLVADKWGQHQWGRCKSNGF